jgi:hypothetical protein
MVKQFSFRPLRSSSAAYITPILVFIDLSELLSIIWPRISGANIAAAMKGGGALYYAVDQQAACAR